MANVKTVSNKGNGITNKGKGKGKGKASAAASPSPSPATVATNEKLAAALVALQVNVTTVKSVTDATALRADAKRKIERQKAIAAAQAIIDGLGAPRKQGGGGALAVEAVRVAIKAHAKDTEGNKGLARLSLSDATMDNIVAYAGKAVVVAKGENVEAVAAARDYLAHVIPALPAACSILRICAGDGINYGELRMPPALALASMVTGIRISPAMLRAMSKAK